MITNEKENYFATLGQKFSDPSSGLKAYWSTLNKIVNKKKTTNIPPLLENGVFLTNFLTKVDILMIYLFNSVLLTLTTACFRIQFLDALIFLFENIEIDPDMVLKEIHSLDSNKAHG